MNTPAPARFLDAEYLEKAMGYTQYVQMVENLLAAGQATGGNHPEIYLHYTKMNLQRMHRLEKTIELVPEAQTAMLGITKPQTWLVLTEGWCGDAAQSMPVMKALADLNLLIEIKVLLRDEHPGLMDQYLTNGTARSIPKLIAIDPLTRKEYFNWGPRPAALQEYFYRMRAENIPADDIKEKFQRWYNTDKTISIQREIAGLAAATAV